MKVGWDSYGLLMGSSRTVKTLTVLLIAMTFGAIGLMILETEPVRPTAPVLEVLAPPPAGAGKVVYETRAPLRVGAWQSLVIHAAPKPTARLAEGCHFQIRPLPAGGCDVLATDHWQKQRPGRHIGGPWRDNSIGICLIGGFSRRRPAREQMASLIDLTHTLQEACGIPAERVYLHSDLVARSASPGAAFPAAEFSASLLRPAR